MISEQLVRSCLFNWLGYGRINSPVWFIGTEEGGAEIWRENTQTLNSSFLLRSNFSLSMDFYHVWEELYGVDLRNFKGITVWHYIASFLLSIEKQERSSENIRNFIFRSRKLGRENSNHFLCELLPLPKRSKSSIEDYTHIWPTIRDYHAEVLPKRFALITDTLKKNECVKLIVSYESVLTKQMLKYHKSCFLVEDWSFGKQKYSLFRISLNSGRTILLLSTPFFGQGQISYDGLDFAAKKVGELIKLHR
ncbi:MAG: hypothetical protein ACYC21_09525 [Eubacteriales bacterium]